MCHVQTFQLALDWADGFPMKEINVGDKVCVYGHGPAAVSEVKLDEESNAIRLILDWGDRGTSKVWLHDEGDVWFRYSDMN